MKRCGVFLLAFLLSFSTVACVSGGGSASGIELVDSSSVSTIDQAEKALWAAAKTFELTLGPINRAHEQGLITEDNYAKVIAGAETFQRYGLAAYKALEVWKSSGDRRDFDLNYQRALAAFAEVKAVR